MEEWKVAVKGLTCANCAGKIEDRIAKLEETERVSINLMRQEMTVQWKTGSDETALREKITQAVHTFEPHVEVSFGRQEAAEVCHCGGCCCGTEHTEEHGQAHAHTEEGVPQTMLLRFGGGLLLFLLAVLLKDSIGVPLYLAAYIVFGYDVLFRAGRNILRGQVFDENFLMSLSTVGAIAIGELPEAVFVMLFYQVGEAFQAYAVARSRKSITALLKIRPDFARLVQGEVLKEVSPEEVAVGDVILVKAGERVPLDGVIEEGYAMLDTAALTGESLPRTAEAGAQVLSGCIALDGMLKVRVEKPFGESTVIKILELVETAAENKSKTERFITRFARVYTPVVVFLAVLVALLPPVLGMGAFSVWFGRALIFLVVSCPCALVLSVPLGYFAGIGAASARGILIKGGNDLDTLAELEQVVFDKTGTLTKGTFTVTEIVGDVLQLAAVGERMSNHPIAKAIVRAYEESGADELPQAEGLQEAGGYGISYIWEKETVLLGNSRLMERENIPYKEAEGNGTVVYVAKGGRFMGHILVADVLKENTKQVFEELKKQGIQKTAMLTGDREDTAKKIAQELELDAFYAELLPEQKLEKLMALKAGGGKTAFVGDGINDAPVLAGADLGIAMGGIGSDAAIEAADVVLMEDDLTKLALGMKIAKNTQKIVKQNIVFALGVKALVLVLSAVGLATMWMAVFADVGVAVLAICNAMRKKD